VAVDKLKVWNRTASEPTYPSATHGVTDIVSFRLRQTHPATVFVSLFASAFHCWLPASSALARFICVCIVRTLFSSAMSLSLLPSSTTQQAPAPQSHLVLPFLHPPHMLRVVLNSPTLDITNSHLNTSRHSLKDSIVPELRDSGSSGVTTRLSERVRGCVFPTNAGPDSCGPFPASPVCSTQLNEIESNQVS